MDDGESVRLRPVDVSDIEVFYLHESDPEALRRANRTARERAAFFAHWQRRMLGDPTVRVRAVMTGDELAGNIAGWWQDGRRLIGFWLGRGFWGRGIGTRALSLFLAPGQEETRPLYAEAAVQNVASVRALKRHGFDELEVIEHGPDEFVVLRLG